MPDSKVTHGREAVYQDIGRNILSLQRLELLLKHLLGRSAVLGDISDWPAVIERRKSKISSQMLGLLAGRLFEELVQRKSTPPSDAPIPGATRSLGSREAAFAFTVTVSDERHAEWQNSLEKLVTDRNRLVHHFLEDFPPDTLDTPEGCQKAQTFLQQQREDIRQEIEKIKHLILCFEQSISTLRDNPDALKFRTDHETPDSAQEPS